MSELSTVILSTGKSEYCNFVYMEARVLYFCLLQNHSTVNLSVGKSEYCNFVYKEIYSSFQLKLKITAVRCIWALFILTETGLSAVQYSYFPAEESTVLRFLPEDKIPVLLFPRNKITTVRFPYRKNYSTLVS